MNALIWLHRWVGAVLGIVLVVLALSGTALLWEDAWIGVPGADDAPASDVAALARVIDTAQGHAPGLSQAPPRRLKMGAGESNKRTHVTWRAGANLRTT